MAIGRTNTGGGGGSGGLNFQVVGGTSAPSNPKENTIWVNTPDKITSWVFSGTEPASLSEGMVWITTGASSPVEFNALKKNGIQVYPIATRQYISGEWQLKTPSVYQGGEWHAVSFTYFYKEGNLYESLTGGYSSPANYDKVVYNDSYIEMTGQNVSCTMTLRTTKMIDVTNLSAIFFTVLKYDGYGDNAKVGITTNASVGADFYTSTSVQESTTAVTYEVDVSTVKGAYYIAVLGVNKAANTTGYHISQIYAI